MVSIYPSQSQAFDEAPLFREVLAEKIMRRLSELGLWEEPGAETILPTNGLGLTRSLNGLPSAIGTMQVNPEEPLLNTTANLIEVAPVKQANAPATPVEKKNSMVYAAAVASVADSTANVVLTEDGTTVTANLILPNGAVSGDCFPSLGASDEVDVVETADGEWRVLQTFIEKADIFTYVAASGDTVTILAELSYSNGIKYKRYVNAVVLSDGTIDVADQTAAANTAIFDDLAALCDTTTVVTSALWDAGGNSKIQYTSRASVKTFHRGGTIASETTSDVLTADSIDVGTNLTIDGTNLRMSTNSLLVLNNDGAGTDKDVADTALFDLLETICLTTDIVSEITSLASTSTNLTLSHKTRTAVPVFKRASLPTDNAGTVQEGLSTVAVGTDINVNGTNVRLATQVIYCIGVGGTDYSTGVTGTNC